MASSKLLWMAGAPLKCLFLWISKHIQIHTYPQGRGSRSRCRVFYNKPNLGPFVSVFDFAQPSPLRRWNITAHYASLLSNSVEMKTLPCLVVLSNTAIFSMKSREWPRNTKFSALRFYFIIFTCKAFGKSIFSALTVVTLCIGLCVLYNTKLESPNCRLELLWMEEPRQGLRVQNQELLGLSFPSWGWSSQNHAQCISKCPMV